VICILSRNFLIADFRLSLCLIVDFNYILRILHRVNMGDVTDVSDLHAVSVFSVSVYGVNFCVFCKARGGGGV
jgi:hypothetical protein